MQQNDLLSTEALKEALTHLGVKEATGNNDGPFVEMLQEWYAGDDELGAPWCALFRSYCDDRAAKRLGYNVILPRTDSSTDLYAFAKKHGCLLDKPIPKCIGLVKGTGGDDSKTHHHTFRVIDVDLKVGVVKSIDGNWGNAVSLTSHRIKDCDFVMCV